MAHHLDKHHVLKVFSGPHLGAEILLGDGEHVIGSNEDADIILHDQLIASRHACLHISGDRVECKGVENINLLLEGQPCKEAVLAPYQLFTLGNTHLAIGPADSPWPAIEYPDFALRPSMLPPAKPSGQDTTGVHDLKQSEDLASGIRMRHLHYILYGIAVGIALLLSVVCTGLVGHPTALSPTPLDLGAVERMLAEAIRKHAPGAIAKACQESGEIRIVGYVDTGKQCRELEKSLSETCPSIHLRLLNSEQLVRSTTQVLEANRLKLNVAKGAPGEVVIRGMMRDRSRLEAAIQQVRLDVPSIRQLTSLVRVCKDAPESSPEETTRLSSSPMAKKNGSTDSKVTAIDISGVNLGVYHWVVLPDGKRVFPGAMLNDGHLVKAITSDGVVLSKDVINQRLSAGEHQ